MKYSYPFVECEQHPGPQRSLLLCEHVFAKKALVAVFQDGTDDEMGHAVCAECRDIADDVLAKAKIACSAHFREIYAGRLMQ